MSRRVGEFRRVRIEDVFILLSMGANCDADWCTILVHSLFFVLSQIDRARDEVGHKN